MIKAIIFDCFGVLTTEGLEVFYAKYFKDSPQKLKQAKDLVRQLNLGQITHEEFIKKVAQLSEVGHNVVRDYIEDNKANEPLLEYIRTKLKPKYKIAMLSNAGANWLSELFDEKDIELFDTVVLSYEVGMAKPDPEIFKLTAERLEVQLNECLFIDDLVHYVEAAQVLGMQAILYKDYFQAEKELEKLLAASTDK